MDETPEARQGSCRRCPTRTVLACGPTISSRNRVGGASQPRPLTPPYVRIRIRRFNLLSILSGRGCSYP